MSLTGLVIVAKSFYKLADALIVTIYRAFRSIMKNTKKLWNIVKQLCLLLNLLNLSWRFINKSY